MNDDEDSIGSWLLSIGLGLAFAVLLALPIAWWLVWSVFR